MDPTEIGIAVILEGDAVLVTRRPPGARYAGFDEFPGGHREGLEPIERCVVREVAEETGLRVRVLRRLTAIDRRGVRGLCRLHFFLCRLAETGALSAPDAAVAPRWVPRRELGRLRFPAANRAVVRWLARCLAPLEEPFSEV